jgi:hypothetical protein
VTTAGPVAVVGATGRVAGHLLGMLGGAGATGVRLGSRQPQPGHERVDARDGASLARFCDGASVVVNCAGPVRLTRGPVLDAAERAGADYVDSAAIGGADPLLAKASHRAIFGAGATPGMSELLIRWLTGRADGPVGAVTGYAAVMDAMSGAAAEDFLESLTGDHGEAGAARRGGVRSPHALAPISDRRIPFFPADVVAYPFLGADAVAVAEALGIPNLCWYQVFAAESPVLAVLRRQRLGSGVGQQPVHELTAAVNAAIAGRQPYQQFVVEQVAGPVAQVAVLRGGSTYRLTAAMLAAGVAELLAGTLAPGRHRAALVLDPESLTKALALAGDAQVSVLAGRLADYEAYEAGAV